MTKRLLAILVLLLAAAPALAATFYWQTSSGTNWANGTVYNASSGGTGYATTSSTVNTATSTVDLNTWPVVLDYSPSVGTIQSLSGTGNMTLATSQSYGGTLRWSGSKNLLTLNSGANLTLTGTMNGSGTLNAGIYVNSINASLTDSSYKLLSGGATAISIGNGVAIISGSTSGDFTTTTNLLTISSGTVYFNGTLTVAPSSQCIIAQNGGTITSLSSGTIANNGVFQHQCSGGTVINTSGTSLYVVPQSSAAQAAIVGGKNPYGLANTAKFVLQGPTFDTSGSNTLSTAAAYGYAGSLVTPSLAASNVYTAVPGGTFTPVPAAMVLASSYNWTSGANHGNAGTIPLGSVLATSGGTLSPPVVAPGDLWSGATAISGSTAATVTGTMSTATSLVVSSGSIHGVQGLYVAPAQGNVYGTFGVSQTGTISGSYSNGSAFAVSAGSLLSGYTVPSGAALTVTGSASSGYPSISPNIVVYPNTFSNSSGTATVGAFHVPATSDTRQGVSYGVSGGSVGTYKRPPGPN